MIRRLFLQLLPALFFTGRASGNPAIVSTDKKRCTIAFGCCNHVHLHQPMWRHIVSKQPELFLWLGDVVYADTEDPAVMQAMFKRQYIHSDYTQLRENVPVLGIWDDHDYGGNNLGRENPIKHDAQQLFLDFLDEPSNSHRRRQQGIYTSYSIGHGEREIKLILLDTRFHRDRPGLGRADTLGEAQWQWLENELAHSNAKIHLIASSYSVLSTQIPGAEEWKDFKWARKRLFHLLLKYRVSGPLFLTGDRHFAAYLQEVVGGVNWYELMSSGLTHYLRRPRVSEILRAYYGRDNSFFGKNFGTLEVNWDSKVEAVFRVYDENNETQLTKKLTLDNGKWQG